MKMLIICALCSLPMLAELPWDLASAGVHQAKGGWKVLQEPTSQIAHARNPGITAAIEAAEKDPGHSRIKKVESVQKAFSQTVNGTNVALLCTVTLPSGETASGWGIIVHEALDGACKVVSSAPGVK